MTEDPSRPTVVLSDRQDRPIATEPLIELAVRTLEAEVAGPAELSVSLVGAEEMAELHRRYLGEEGPTDVLAFPQDDGGSPGGERLLGDVVICPEAAHAGDPDAELRLLLVHGILHLLGYDHEDEEERKAMWARQETYSGVRVP